MAQDFNLNIFQRVREKKETYRLYNFEPLQSEAFATFFDLAQEYTSLENLYQICVAVPKEFFDLDSRLYVINPKTSKLQKVCTSEEGLIPADRQFDVTATLSEEPYETEDARVFPIRGNQALAQWIPFLGRSPILGVFEIYPKSEVDIKERFFLEKFTNRIGYNIHQKLLFQQNIEHIKFISELVADIEHNVISPNMYYKLFLIRLRNCLQAYYRMQTQLGDLVLFLQDKNIPLSKHLTELYQALCENNQSLDEERRALSKHYEHTSLFLEALFRRDHFEKGTYVLRKQSVNFRTDIIQPLLERYLPLFEKQGIMVDNRLESVPDEQITLSVDKGLISQVFDNLFSNALKYTREVEDQFGNKIKLISYNRQILKNCFGQGINGVRFNIFTTGAPLLEEEARRIFEEGYRAPSAGQERGTGHGLHFTHKVVEIHGGAVGCDPQRYGNLFYFVLPLQIDKSREETTALLKA
ncbi:MAG: sensor histidine kinase [Syntrophobacteraceae bacterium]